MSTFSKRADFSARTRIRSFLIGVLVGSVFLNIALLFLIVRRSMQPNEMESFLLKIPPGISVEELLKDVPDFYSGRIVSDLGELGHVFPDPKKQVGKRAVAHMFWGHWCVVYIGDDDRVEAVYVGTT